MNGMCENCPFLDSCQAGRIESKQRLEEWDAIHTASIVIEAESLLAEVFYDPLVNEAQKNLVERLHANRNAEHILQETLEFMASIVVGECKEGRPHIENISPNERYAICSSASAIADEHRKKRL